MAGLSGCTETVLFVAITLALAYILGAAFILSGERHPLIIHALMCVPGAVALTLMWLLRREPPRTVGFEFTDASSWAIAAFYPLVFVAVALALAYIVRMSVVTTTLSSLNPAMCSMSFWGIVSRDSPMCLWRSCGCC